MTATMTEATLGRIRYLKQTSLHPERMEWYQRPVLQPPSGVSAGGDIRRGFDFLTTSVAFQRLRVPASMLGPGMEPFDEIVEFRGAPLADSVGASDTIMERLEDATFGREIVTQLVGFGNVSARPISLRGTGALAGDYDLFVTLSPTVPSFGRATYHTDDAGMSGRVDSEISLTPLFELRPVRGGESLFVDTGVTPVPGFPMGLTNDSSRWSRVPTHEGQIGWSDFGESLYYPEDVLIVAKEGGGDCDTAHLKSVLQAYTRLPEGRPDRIESVRDALPMMQAACLKAG